MQTWVTKTHKGRITRIAQGCRSLYSTQQQIKPQLIAQIQGRDWRYYYQGEVPSVLIFILGSYGKSFNRHEKLHYQRFIMHPTGFFLIGSCGYMGHGKFDEKGRECDRAKQGGAIKEILPAPSIGHVCANGRCP